MGVTTVHVAHQQHMRNGLISTHPSHQGAPTLRLVRRMMLSLAAAAGCAFARRNEEQYLILDHYNYNHRKEIMACSRSSSLTCLE